MKNKAFSKNHSELARDIGESRQWVALAAKRDGAPTPRDDGRHDIEAWKKFRDATKAATLDTPDMIELKRLIAAEDLRKKKAFNDETEGRVTDTEQLAREAGPTLSSFKDLLYQKIGQELPTAMAGVDVPTGRLIGNRVAGELLAKFQEAFRRWGV